ncbi:Glu/Leu/Phe/Val dehydrogenase dimerization domain-containing protein [Actinomadura madurae]|uniref:Valine dehydrogenase (NAD+) n=1 Tax=Actinomadura madurae TaxID=1993 RepID=A0A1I5TKI6_9ACTN|nr:Glu/Leu/Phe/Val dehydrogenase dimerization domain-containing protein [Actinomadura madurae]SFP83488.1 valine dehydrogenase (NAD+) [Actinomadura madurae]SPT51702.1 Valine dehydrogenase [Actinomadura madurae]
MTHAVTRTDGLEIEQLAVPGFEDVRLAAGPFTGLRSIVAIHDTTLGPALGGTRFFPYADADAALHDVRRLSEGMTHKAAAAGLALGGGKAVIIGDPAVLKSPDLLRAYGRFVDSFGGRYITAADIGTNSDDLDVIGETTSHVVGRTVAAGGLGDSGHSTALGVFVSMRAAAEVVLDRSLQDLTIGVEGIGKVGLELVGLLHAAGAKVVVTDPAEAARRRAVAAYPDVEVVDDVLEVFLDVYAPCALGATVTSGVARELSARIVCGAANNQLVAPEAEYRMAERGIVWVPDFVANAGGLIQVAAERAGAALDGARARIHQLGETVTDILERAAAEAVTPGEAAQRIVADRLAGSITRD